MGPRGLVPGNGTDEIYFELGGGGLISDRTNFNKLMELARQVLHIIVLVD